MSDNEKRAKPKYEAPAVVDDDVDARVGVDAAGVATEQRLELRVDV